MKTIYIGGGTNFIISETVRCATKRVREQLTFDDRNEFTVEANPGDLTQEKLQVMKNYGVNRLSMGVQTFDDRLLKNRSQAHRRRCL